MTLSDAARFGPYFQWDRGTAGDAWLPWARLAEPEVAAERVAAARTVMVRMTRLTPDDVPVRVVASIVFLGYAARIVSPLLAATVLGGSTPAVTAGDLWWRAVEGGPLPLAYVSEGFDSAETGSVLDGLLGPLSEVFRSAFHLSPQVLRGNVASALGGASAMIAAAAPELAAPAARIVGGLIGDAADLVRPDPGVQRWVLVRRNCCLYYRIPGGGTCGDCVLNTRPERTHA